MALKMGTINIAVRHPLPHYCPTKRNAGSRPKATCGKRIDYIEETGAGEEIRTLDPNLGKVVLYH
jgi:hypothetical protein